MYIRMELCSSSFSHHTVSRALKALDKDMHHMPQPAAVITPQCLRDVLYVISQLKEYVTLKFLFIVMYLSMLRQSNYAAPTVEGFDKSRQLTRSDVREAEGGLAISVKWEKNMQRMANSAVMFIPTTYDPALCPVLAYREMINRSPTRCPTQPLIVFRDNKHMPLSFIQKIWRKAIIRLGLDTNLVRLHGLRRGGATYVASYSEESRQKLQDYGRWKSSCYRRYINAPQACPIFQAFKRI